MTKYFLFPQFLLPLLLIIATHAYAAPESAKKPANPLDALKGENSNEPTFIDSDSLTLNSNDRAFTYLGNVKVTKGDMILTADRVEGSYTENNKINSLVAKKNVVIIKGPTIRATSDKAIYDAAKEIITLVENPEITQEGNTLSADVVKIFLAENRSVAEGQVRMKMLNGAPTPVVSAAVIATAVPVTATVISTELPRKPNPTVKKAKK